MAVNLSPVAGAAAQFFDNSGNVLTGGKIYTYDAGTTTPAPTYTNSSGITAHPNPIVLNAAGRVPDSGEIWLSDSVSYKFVLKDANEVLIGTYDNLVGINSNFVNFTGEEEQQTATQGQTVFTLTTLNYQPATNNLLVFVNGSKQISGTNYQETSSTIVTFVDGLNVGDVVDFCTATPINTAIVNANAVTYNEGDAGAIDRTVESKLQESVSVLDFGADATGVADSNIAVQDAVNAARVVVFPFGGVYSLTTDINIPANTKIIIQKETIVTNTGGRFTAYDVDNVEWVIDGELKSVAMTTAPALPGWPAIVNSYFGNERGFIEFGSASTTTPRSGFVVSGSGSISGDWTGTAAAATSADVNFKGVCCFTSSNVYISNVEVFGFRGEAVYAWTTTANSVNVVFDTVYSHDNKFNALNFNAINAYKNWKIVNCLTDNCYAGIEMSVGEAINNSINNATFNGIWTGVGAGLSVNIIGNTVYNSGSIGIYMGYATLTSGTSIIANNRVIISGTFGYLISKTGGFSLLNNICSNWAQTGSGYAFQVSDSNSGVIQGNSAYSPGSHTLGYFFTTFNNTNLQVGFNTTLPNVGNANINKEYEEGAFVPVPTNLTIVGTATYLGKYTRIGRAVMWLIEIVPTGASTTASTISTTTFTGIGFTAANQSICNSASAVVASYGNGIVSGTTIYPPSWSATNAVVTISGTFFV